MEDANKILIAMGIGLGIVIIFGIYKIATSNLHERNLLKTGTPEHSSRQTLKTIIAILLTILLFIALYVTYEMFV